jgi:hypothetical protein
MKIMTMIISLFDDDDHILNKQLVDGYQHAHLDDAKRVIGVLVVVFAKLVED